MTDFETTSRPLCSSRFFNNNTLYHKLLYHGLSGFSMLAVAVGDMQAFGRRGAAGSSAIKQDRFAHATKFQACSLPLQLLFMDELLTVCPLAQVAAKSY